MNLINTIKNIFKKKVKHLEKDLNYNSNLNQNELDNNKNELNNNKIQINENIENQIYIKKTTDNKNIHEIQTITIQELKNNLNTIWDIIKIKENTQAEHIIKSIPSDNWTTMDELRQNIKLEFGIEYKNEKSLYPYLKTLTDINLIKVNNTGKKRTWKKNIIILDNNK
ncbi:MAG: hypothetical protein PHR26_00990 [Candidatus ainarchaeum sp.]|nr:hypothetical protein [Candidatus ainarchaeum sp.]MDD3975857.1 hypothetical protein [Candidatus ainarchaeum sp.]